MERIKCVYNNIDKPIVFNNKRLQELMERKEFCRNIYSLILFILIILLILTNT